MHTEETTPIDTMTNADFATYVAAIVADEPWLLDPDAWDFDDTPDVISIH